MDDFAPTAVVICIIGSVAITRYYALYATSRRTFTALIHLELFETSRARKPVTGKTDGRTGKFKKTDWPLAAEKSGCALEGVSAHDAFKTALMPANDASSKPKAKPKKPKAKLKVAAKAKKVAKAKSQTQV